MFWWETGRLLQQLRFQEGSERCLNKTACAEKAPSDGFSDAPNTIAPHSIAFRRCDISECTRSRLTALILDIMKPVRFLLVILVAVAVVKATLAVQNKDA